MAASSDGQSNSETRPSGVSTVSTDSTLDGLCRICFSGNKVEQLASPCLCKGTVGNVHVTCLEHWLSQSNTQNCDLCGFPFRTVRKPKYTVRYSVFYWIFKETESDFRMGLHMDLLILLFITPILISACYLCVAIGNYYSKGSTFSPPATWTTVGMFVTVLILTYGYYLWVSVAIRVHGRNWYRWWQAHNEVKLLWKPGDELSPGSSRLIVVETELMG